MNTKVHHYEPYLELRRKMLDYDLQHWLRYEVFSFNWWLLLAVTVLIIWLICKFWDRGRTFELLTYYSIIGIISMFLDTIGTHALLWFYPYKLIPIVPPLIPLDLVMVTGFYVMVYQHTSKWWTFTLFSTLVAALFSFVLEPIMIWLGLYQIVRWHVAYSFPIYVLLASFARWLVLHLLTIERQHQQ